MDIRFDQSLKFSVVANAIEYGIRVKVNDAVYTRYKSPPGELVPAEKLFNGLTIGDEGTFAVRSVSKVGKGEWSGEYDFTLVGPPLPPLFEGLE